MQCLSPQLTSTLDLSAAIFTSLQQRLHHLPTYACHRRTYQREVYQQCSQLTQEFRGIEGACEEQRRMGKEMLAEINSAIDAKLPTIEARRKGRESHSAARPSSKRGVCSKSEEKVIGFRRLLKRKKVSDGEMKAFLERGGALREEEIYICYMCFGLQELLPIWTHSQSYLHHLQQQHQIIPDFGILRSLRGGVPLSHVFFKGKLGAYSKYLLNDDLIRVYYYWKTEQYDRLYICACSATVSRNLNIFFTGKDYYKHVYQYHAGVTSPTSSHRIQTDGLNSWAVKQHRSQFYTSQFIEDIMKGIQKRILSQHRRSKPDMGRFLLRHPLLNTFDIISRHSQLLPASEAYEPLPLCSLCGQPFATVYEFKQHATNVHSSDNSYNCAAPLNTSNGLLYLSKMGQKSVGQAVELQGFNKEENSLLNLSLWLLRDIMICGECNEVFQTAEEYLLHIHDAHPSLSPNNTHLFKPLLTQEQLHHIILH